MKVQVKIIDIEYYYSAANFTSYTNGALPSYATEQSAGMDLRTMKDFSLTGGSSMLIPTGIAIHINDPNVAAHVMPRSGLGHKEGIILGNTIGLIDSDYQGELMLSIWNRSNTTRYFRRGDRIAQLVFLPIIRATLEVVEEFETTERGAHGFGSTGV